MAKMWPQQIPSWVRRDRRRSAEIRVFNQLETFLDDMWSVFYSRPWYGINQNGGEIEGEADFILAHPDQGILFLEVKGGKISYEPDRSQWFSIDRDNIKHKIKDPLEQAKKCRFEFAKKLESQREWPHQFINYKYGVVFTDTSEPISDILTIGGHDKTLFCHAAEFQNNFESWIFKRLAKHGRESERVGPGRAGVDVINSLIAQPVTLNLTLAARIHDEIESMDALFTGAQLQVIHNIKNQSRIVVSGGAGTGKTVLATEIANSYGQILERVLLLTCSPTLTTSLQKTLSGNTNITINTVEHFFVSGLAEKQWDVLIIDEGQDVEWADWQRIEASCEPVSGKLIVFMDSNQSLYRIPADLSTLLGAESHYLSINLRNTKKIAKSTETLYTGPLILAPGPEGNSCVIIYCNKFEMAIREAVKIVKVLTNVEAVKLNEITVLCGNKESRQKIMYEFSEEKILAVNAGQSRTGVLCIETVPLFKGLESTIVIAICDAEWAKSQEMAYVSISRARSRFYLIGNVAGTLIEKALKESEAT